MDILFIFKNILAALNLHFFVVATIDVSFKKIYEDIFKILCLEI